MHIDEQDQANREQANITFLQRRGRTMALLGALLFVISIAFPVLRV